MFTGIHPLISIDYSASTQADRRRGDRARDQRSAQRSAQRASSQRGHRTHRAG